MAQLKLINGLPVTQTEYDESIAYPSGLAANTNITLPNSGAFYNASAKDILVIVNDRVVEWSSDGSARDFTITGSTPYTQIKFNYDLMNNTIVRFKMNV